MCAKFADAAQALYAQALVHLLQGNYDAAWPLLDQVYLSRRGPQIPQSDWPVPTQVTLPKLRHDAEQLAYLLDEALLDTQAFHRIQQAFASIYQTLFAMHGALAEPVNLSPEQGRALQGALGRHWFSRAPVLSTPVLNPDLDFEAVEHAYLTQKPGFAVMDQILSPVNQVLLLRYFQQVSIWHDYWRGAYVGAYLEDGCHGPWLGQLAQALQRAFPKTLGRFPLNACWAYKYDANHPGIGPHADAQGQILWSVWLTPDTANLDPKSGGLNVYGLTVPPDFRGSQTQQAQFLDALRQSPFVKVAYRSNRALMFNGGLIHSTDRMTFKPGYLNRRINLTLVFGLRPYGPEDQTRVLTRNLLPVCR